MFRILCLSVISVILLSCENEKTKKYDLLLDSYIAKEIYKLKVPDSSFVFCLDSIKTYEEFEKLNLKYCKNETRLDAYMYLSSYDVYLPILLNYYCDGLDITACGITRNQLSFVVNRKFQWLVEDELVNEMDQRKMDSIVSRYYLDLKNKKINNSAIIKYKVSSIKNNDERDSLYVSLVKSYYHFIKSEKMKREINIEDLEKEYPLRLFIGRQYNLILPPPSIIIKK